MTPKEQWTAVDQYICDMLLPPDPALDGALSAATAAGLPAINVTANQGKLLMLLAQMIGAKKILEIGTLGGFSTLWLARGLAPGGKVITLELEEKCANVARASFARAGLSNVIELRLGSALTTLPKLAAEGAGPFDLIFIDADKVTTPQYFEWAMKLSHTGSLIIVDNVVRDGNIIDGTSKDSGIVGIRKFNEMVKSDKRVTATALQTVGSKGYDGFAVIRVVS